MGETENSAYAQDFDPNADPTERRKIRLEYRNLITEVRDNRHDLIRPESDGLHRALDRAEELHKQVKATREAALDANFLVLAAHIGTEQAQQLQTDFVTFDPSFFVEKLITFMGGREIAAAAGEDDDDGNRQHARRRANLDWHLLGRKVCCCFRQTPKLNFMFGPLKLEPPKKIFREPNRRHKPDIRQKITPSELNKVENKQETTTKEVYRVHRALLKACYPNGADDEDEEPEPVGFFEFVVNPASFNQTIENIFHFAFLVKDGKASITLDGDGLPVVCPENPYHEEQHAEVVKRQQVIMGLTVQEFEEIVKTFGIKKSMIPARQHRYSGAEDTIANGHATHNDDENDDYEMEDAEQ